MYRHVIPQNISDNGDFFNGAIKKRNFYEAVALFLVGLLILKFALFAVPLIYKAIIFVFCPCLITVFALIGIGDQSLFECLGTIVKYKTTKDILHYSLHTDKDELSLSKKEAKEKEKVEKQELKKAKRKKSNKGKKDNSKKSSKNTNKKKKGKKKAVPKDDWDADFL